MAALSAPRRRAGGREYVLVPKLGCTLLCGENARASGLLGRIQAVRPYDALSDAEKQGVVGPRGDEMVRLQVYEQCSASRDGVARLDLTTRHMLVVFCTVNYFIGGVDQRVLDGLHVYRVLLVVFPVARVDGLALR